ncbi:MAG TPA: hypothetical protein VGR57_01195 [Ktedonobacterales bacterium]|nr:hypothetical protein [Ktedonobacterales bacterium]
MVPTLAWRIELATTAAIGGAVALALILIVLFALWRRGESLPTLLAVVGLLPIMLGLCVAGTLDSIGFRQGWDAVPYALGAQLGGTLLGASLSGASLILRRRAASR